MAETIRSTRSGIETIYHSLEAALDALETGTLSPDDLAWDSQRGKWVAVRDHFAIGDAWFDRQQYRRVHERQRLSDLPSTAPAFPSLTDLGMTPARGVTAAAKSPFQQATAQPAQPALSRMPYLRGEQALIWFALSGVVLLLTAGLVALVSLARTAVGLAR